MATLIENNFLENLHDKLSNFPYKHVYVSIGSKFNQTYIQINGRSEKTNANIQILPKFLKKEEQLIIMIDRISTEDSKLDHLEYINDRVSNNSKCILLNRYADKDFIEGFFDILLPKLFDHYIDPNNFIISTFLRFLNSPNEIERNSATMIQKTIYDYLKLFQDEIYLNCFYEWFGYEDILRDYIYNYNKLKTLQISSKHIYEVKTILKKLLSHGSTSTMVLQNQDISNVLDIIISLHIKKTKEDKYLESMYSYFIRKKCLVEI
tara:strand:- start:12899 stop:13690 length:792 start_codon:yes stop_codon:yes gene_type:complete